MIIVSLSPDAFSHETLNVLKLTPFRKVSLHIHPKPLYLQTTDVNPCSSHRPLSPKHINCFCTLKPIVSCSFDRIIVLFTFSDWVLTSKEYSMPQLPCITSSSNVPLTGSQYNVSVLKCTNDGFSLVWHCQPVKRITWCRAITIRAKKNVTTVFGHIFNAN